MNHSVWLAVLVAALPLSASLSSKGSAQTPPASSETQAQSDLRARYSGTFVPIGGGRNQANIDAAIERVVQQMVFFAQGIARARLHEVNPVFPTIVFSFPAGSIEVTTPGHPVRSPDDGSQSSAIGINGDRSNVTQRFENGRLIQTMWTDAGSRRTEFSLAPDNTTLHVRVTITSGRLPLPIQYELLYRRH